MSTTTRSVRHHEVMGSFSGGTFTSRGTRDGVPPKPAPARKRQFHVDTTARVKTAAAKLTRDAVAATGAFDRMGESLDRLATGLRAIADQRGGAAAAAARDAAIAERSSPASVQAANAARWPRAGR